MRIFRVRQKKPLIEALLYDGTNEEDLAHFAGAYAGSYHTSIPTLVLLAKPSLDMIAKLRPGQYLLKEHASPFEPPRLDKDSIVPVPNRWYVFDTPRFSVCSQFEFDSKYEIVEEEERDRSPPPNLFQLLLQNRRVTKKKTKKKVAKKKTKKVRKR